MPSWMRAGRMMWPWAWRWASLEADVFVAFVVPFWMLGRLSGPAASGIAADVEDTLLEVIKTVLFHAAMVGRPGQPPED